MLNKIRCIIIIETTFFSIQYHPAETICVIWTNFYYSNCSSWKQTVQRNQSAFSVKDQFKRMVIKFDFKLTKLLQVMCLTYLELPLCEKYIENLNSFNGLMELLSHFWLKIIIIFIIVIIMHNRKLQELQELKLC